MPRSRAAIGAAVALAVLAAGLISLLFVPNGYERAGWQLRQMWVKLLRVANVQPSVLPTPDAPATVQPSMLTPIPVSALETETPDPAAPTLEADDPPPTAATPLPVHADLSGVTHVWQKINNCGPATLAMGLSFWGWKGTQANTAVALKPNPNDVNVSPEEMAAYAESLGLGALVRRGGTAALLKALIVGGFPVIVEKGLVLEEEGGWQGHYVLVTGYLETARNFTTQDSLQGPNALFPYRLLEENWRAFNYTYVVLFPPGRRAEVEAILGEDMDLQANYQRAANMAREDIATLSSTARAFGWFNLGTNLLALDEPLAAASAYDQARLAGLPWRMVWYQFGPLEAYYAVGRYVDVIDLADATLAQANNVEEVYYWRGRARLAQGDQAGAVADWRAALRYNRSYAAPRQALAELGLAP